ncbi:hypothetical protein MHZ90_22170 [Pantoea sp. ACRSH]|uniref:hypothetical protein n=1 Tax=unclassified Pantoea TaxID=2630326 RepID=UPI001EF69922|nr:MULTISPECIES: hypothetical protein [unclassified Pantoea]MCG7368787.1 hypothetical protein [Pantoea sp. ACRSH]MCG7399163.1 hypothetical protein [Pantoea sp. ACRSC]
MSQRIENLRRLGELRTLIDRESDKGLVLTLTSLIETTIQEILSAFLVQNAASKDYVTNTYSAPIKKRTQLTCSLGLICELEMNSINTICEIRNQFAHNWNVNFDTDKVSKKMEALAGLWIRFDRESNQKFQQLPKRKLFDKIAFMLLTDLVHRAEEVSLHRLKPMEWSRTWIRKMEDDLP